MTNEKNIEKRSSGKRKFVPGSEQPTSKRGHPPVAPVSEVKVVTDVFSRKWVPLEDYNRVAPQVAQIERIQIYRRIEHQRLLLQQRLQQRLQQEQQRLVIQLGQDLQNLQKDIAHCTATGVFPLSQVGLSTLLATVSSVPQSFFASQSGSGAPVLPPATSSRATTTFGSAKSAFKRVSGS